MRIILTDGFPFPFQYCLLFIKKNTIAIVINRKFWIFSIFQHRKRVVKFIF